jgi:hypothetical protein
VIGALGPGGVGAQLVGNLSLLVAGRVPDMIQRLEQALVLNHVCLTGLLAEVGGILTNEENKFLYHNVQRLVAAEASGALRYRLPIQQLERFLLYVLGQPAPLGLELIWRDCINLKKIMNITSV